MRRSRAQPFAAASWRAIRQVGHQLGVDFRRYPIRDASPGSLDAKLGELFRRRRISCVLDVGAHIGEFGSQLRGLPRYEGQILSFEPGSRAFASLEIATAQDPLWSAMNVAVSSHEGDAVLQVHESSNLSSFLGPSELGKGILKMDQPEAESVSTIRLDSIRVPPGELMLKSDTQGHDLQVIEGAEGILDRTVAILAETAVRPLYEGAPLLPDLISAMASRGYELAGLYPVLSDTDGLRVVEFDALFLRAGAEG